MKIKLYLKSILWFIIPLLIFVLIINTLYYFDIINNTTIKYFKILSILISSFTCGFIRGKTSINKGYLNGLKLSSIIVLFFFILSLLFKEFNLLDLIYYIIITLTITFGSMVGINKKEI